VAGPGVATPLGTLHHQERGRHGPTVAVMVGHQQDHTAACDPAPAKKAKGLVQGKPFGD